MDSPFQKIPLNPPLQKGEAVGMPGFIENLHHFVKKRQNRIGKNFVIEVGIQLYDFNLLNFLNEQESISTTGTLFEHLVDESATITYAQRL